MNGKGNTICIGMFLLWVNRCMFPSITHEGFQSPAQSQKLVPLLDIKLPGDFREIVWDSSSLNVIQTSTLTVFWPTHLSLSETGHPTLELLLLVFLPVVFARKWGAIPVLFLTPSVIITPQFFSSSYIFSLLISTQSYATIWYQNCTLIMCILNIKFCTDVLYT